MDPEQRTHIVEVKVRRLGARLGPRYWITATVGYGRVDGGWFAFTEKRAQRKAVRVARRLVRKSTPFHGPMRWTVTWPGRDLHDLRAAYR